MPMKRFKPLTFGWIDRSAGDYRLILLGLMLMGYLVTMIPQQPDPQTEPMTKDAVSVTLPPQDSNSLFK